MCGELYCPSCKLKTWRCDDAHEHSQRQRMEDCPHNPSVLLHSVFTSSAIDTTHTHTQPQLYMFISSPLQQVHLTSTLKYDESLIGSCTCGCTLMVTLHNQHDICSRGGHGMLGYQVGCSRIKGSGFDPLCPRPKSKASLISTSKPISNLLLNDICLNALFGCWYLLMISNTE